MDEAMQRSPALYKSRLKAQIEPEQHGQVVAIHPDLGNYIISETAGDAMRALYARQPIP